MTDKTLFILTVGNTGSSQFAKMLNEMGIPIYDKYIENGRDFYENRLMIEENLRILGKDKDVVDLKEISGTPRNDLRGILKDPRTVVTFPFWYDVYPEAKYVFLQRNPDDILLTKARFSRNLPFFDQRMRCFYCAMISCKKFLYVHYDMLSFDFEATMQKVADYCEVDYGPVSKWEPKYYGQIINREC